MPDPKSKSLPETGRTILILDNYLGAIESLQKVPDLSISATLDAATSTTKIEMKYPSGSKDVEAYVCEFKYPNDPISMYRTIEAIDPDYVLVVGRGIGLRDDVRVGDVVVADDIVSFTSTKSLAEEPDWRINWYPCLSKSLDYRGIEKNGGHVKVGKTGSFSNVVSSARELREASKRAQLLCAGYHANAVDLFRLLHKEPKVDCVTLITDHVDSFYKQSGNLNLEDSVVGKAIAYVLEHAPAGKPTTHDIAVTLTGVSNVQAVIKVLEKATNTTVKVSENRSKR